MLRVESQELRRGSLQLSTLDSQLHHPCHFHTHCVHSTMLPRPLTFRQRILWALLALGVLPTGAVLVSWALTLQNGSTAEAMRTAVDSSGITGRVLIETLDTTKLTLAERHALAVHRAS